MTKHWRTVVEVAVLGAIAMLLPVFGLCASVPVFNFFGAWGLSLNFLDSPAMLIGVAFPYLVGFCYGYRRKLQFHLVPVWIGWLIGWIAYGGILKITLFRHARLPSHRMPTPSVTDWLIWAGWTLFFPLLPALVTMLGQRIRVRAAQSR